MIESISAAKHESVILFEWLLSAPSQVHRLGFVFISFCLWTRELTEVGTGTPPKVFVCVENKL